MSFDNILGNITSTAICVVIGYYLRVIRTRFKEIKQRRDETVNWVKNWSSFNASYELRLELISYLQLERDKLQFLVYGIELLLLLETILIFFIIAVFPDFNLSLKVTEWNFPVFLLFAFFILFIYTSFALMQYVDDLNQFEDTFSDGLMARIKHLNRIDATKNHSEDSRDTEDEK